MAGQVAVAAGDPEIVQAVQAAGGLHGLNDLRIARRHRDLAGHGRLGRLQHAHDHRRPADVGQGLARQARGGHAGRDDHDGVHQPR